MSMITVAAKIVLNFALIRPFGFLGLPLATTAASWINFGLLLRRLRQTTEDGVEIGSLGVYLRIAFASLIMGALCLLVFHASWEICPGPGWLAQAFRLGMAIAAGITALFPLLRILKVEEGKSVLLLAGSLFGRLR
jgi:peptidoglycan biosynthesis protein MviN/MurJ (putative lipid II flippase)